MPKATDAQTVTAIARLLGTDPEWSSPADFLDEIAALVATTGRQHPGDADPETYNPHPA